MNSAQSRTQKRKSFWAESDSINKIIAAFNPLISTDVPQMPQTPQAHMTRQPSFIHDYIHSISFPCSLNHNSSATIGNIPNPTKLDQTTPHHTTIHPPAPTPQIPTTNPPLPRTPTNQSIHPLIHQAAHQQGCQVSKALHYTITPPSALLPTARKPPTEIK